MNLQNSRSLKNILAAVASVIALIAAAQPYLNVVAENKVQDSKINLLEQQQKTDHDTIIRMSSDITYIRETVKELKDNLRK